MSSSTSLVAQREAQFSDPVSPTVAPAFLRSPQHGLQDRIPKSCHPASLNDSNRPMIKETERLLQAAQARDQAAVAISAEEVFELVLALSWAIDRYGDTEAVARRRVMIGTVGVFVPPTDQAIVQDLTVPEPRP